MRSGAIFARGSCRALAWMLALMAVVALSAGEAAGQASSVTVSKGTVEVEEGGTASFNVSLNRAPTATVTTGTAQGAVTVTVAIASDNMGADFTYTIDGVPITQDATSGAFTGENTITFPAGVAPDSHQIGILSAEDDDAKNGRVVLSFTAAVTDGAPAIAPKTVIINEDDNDAVRVHVAPRSLRIPEGGMDTYTIVLGSQPTNDVTVALRVSNTNSAISAKLYKDGAAGTPTDLSDDMDFSSIVFVMDAADSRLTGDTDDADNVVLWSAPQTITVMAGEDANVISGRATISHTLTTIDTDYAATRAPSVTVNEVDSVREIMLSVSADSVEEGDSVDITAQLVHPDEDFTGSLALSEDVTVALKLDRNPAAAGSYSLSPSSIVIAAGTVAKTITLYAEQDRDDDHESLSFTSSVSGTTTVVLGDAQKVKVAIEDDDTYTLTASKTEVNEGDEVTLTVEVEPNAALDTMVKIELYQASGATVEPGPGDVPDYVMINEGESEAEFTLTTAKDADSDEETIVARARVDSSIVGEDLTITVLDGLDYELSLQPDSIGEADGEASVMVKVETNKAISTTKDTMLTLAVDPAGTSTATAMDDYSIMPEMAMVTIPKGEMMGMTTVMVTPVADGMDEPNETIVLNLWLDDKQVGNNATLTIIDGDSTTFTLSGPSDMNLVEGFEYDIEVTASSAVRVDTTVMIMAGEGSTATEDDYMIEDIMIMAGETMGRTKLMVKSDDMPDGGTAGGMAEKLTLYGMVGNIRTNDLSFYIWDLAVPALPVIAQLLLAALMAVGGYRRYRRR